MVSFHFDFISVTIIIIFYLAGFILALNAVFQSRTPQGTMAWILALLCIPFLAVPIFLLFGKKKIEDYDHYENGLTDIRRKIESALSEFKMLKDTASLRYILSNSNLSFRKGNSLSLLFDGQETFEEMLSSIKKAKKYIFLQMYIFRTDKIGTVFADELRAKASQGVKIYILYERLGIHMSKKVLRDMKSSGIFLGVFSPIRLNKLQLNFRNHRKLLIIDGETGFFGGINIGDDYLGRYPEIGYWRDTNIRIRGPTVGLSQIDFIKDWKYSQNEEITCDILGPFSCGDSDVLLLNSGPAEERPLNLLQHIGLINSARGRLWIANPYIIPPQGIMDALFIAAIRGVDIRLLVPEKSDNRFVALAMEIYLERLLKAGIRVFKYSRGMMHQKVILVDDNLAVIGSSNLDFRSMHINFENSIVIDDMTIIKELDLALRQDFDFSVELDISEFKLMSFGRRLATHLANSVAPIL